MQNSVDLRYCDFIEGFGQCFTEAIEKGGSKEEMLQNFLISASRIMGGANYYIPKEHARNLEIKERNEKIKREFTGFNQYELANKYGVSVQWIYRILKGNKK